MSSKVVATRLSIEEIAKLRDGLIQRGVNPADLSSLSHILRLSVFTTIMDNCDSPSAGPTEESLEAIKQLISKEK